MGKSKVTPEQRQAAIQAVLNGKPRREVAKQYKVSLPTVHLWMAQGRKAGAGQNSDVVRRLERLEAQMELLVKLVQRDK